ncbi:MAG: riboflavin synthase [Hyphomicrobiales bacterium]
MFTGIVSDVGVVSAVDRSRGDARFVIDSAYAPASIELGASIACSGACLTVISVTPSARGAAFAVDVSAETLARTTLVDWTVGTRVNLERSLKVGDELGGHIVSGHVDGVGTLAAMAPEGDSVRMTFEVPEALKGFVAQKGSIALDGTSFTVNGVDGRTFSINVIPHTQAVTTWGQVKTGHRVNVEIDMLARYVARLLEAQNT